MIDRALFTPDGSNPPFPVVISDTQTVPTEQMAHLLADLLNTKGDVLEIGTGSGYQTAILAERCRSVTSIEVDPIEGTEHKLPDNVVLIHADGLSYETHEQFDGILVTFGVPGIAESWMNQLAEGARLVVPLSDRRLAKIAVYEKVGDALVLVDIAGYAPFTEPAEA